MENLHVGHKGLITLIGLNDAGVESPFPDGITTTPTSSDPSVFTVEGSGFTATITQVGDVGTTASFCWNAKNADGSEFPTTGLDIQIVAEVASHGVSKFQEL